MTIPRAKASQPLEIACCHDQGQDSDSCCEQKPHGVSAGMEQAAERSHKRAREDEPDPMHGRTSLEEEGWQLAR